jgi:anthranilate synthase component II
MYLLIDNYDSFTYNLWHYLGELGAEVTVKRNDAVSVDEALAMQPEGIVISPGPSDPDHAGICLELVRRCGDIPLLGVCLGHQAVGQIFGGKIVRAPVPMHGKLSQIHHDGSGVFQGFNRGPFQATRYHSLVIERQGMPSCLRVNAETDDGIVMGVAHRERPIHGVQFHPESIASEGGHALLANFLRLSHPLPRAA